LVCNPLSVEILKLVAVSSFGMWCRITWMVRPVLSNFSDSAESKQSKETAVSV